MILLAVIKQAFLSTAQKRKAKRFLSCRGEVRITASETTTTAWIRAHITTFQLFKGEYVNQVFTVELVQQNDCSGRRIEGR